MILYCLFAYYKAILFIILSIFCTTGVLVCWMLYFILKNFNEKRNNALEMVWTFFPAVILLIIAVPSFCLLSDEAVLGIDVLFTTFSVKAITSNINSKFESLKKSIAIKTEGLKFFFSEEVVLLLCMFIFNMVVVISFATSQNKQKQALSNLAREYKSNNEMLAHSMLEIKKLNLSLAQQNYALNQKVSYLTKPLSWYDMHTQLTWFFNQYGETILYWVVIPSVTVGLACLVGSHYKIDMANLFSMPDKIQDKVAAPQAASVKQFHLVDTDNNVADFIWRTYSGKCKAFEITFKPSSGPIIEYSDKIGGMDPVASFMANSADSTPSEFLQSFKESTSIFEALYVGICEGIMKVNPDNCKMVEKITDLSVNAEPVVHVINNYVA